VETIKEIKSRNGVDGFFFTDSVFNDVGSHFLDLAEELLVQNAGIRWSAFFRPQGMTAKKISLLKRSGLYAMEVGTDASTDETLMGLNKNFSFQDVVEFQKMSTDAEIPCAHFIIFGGPGETTATIHRGLQNIERLNKCVVFAFSGIRIFPNTDLHAQAIEEGVLKKKDPLLLPVYYYSPHVHSKEMNETIKNAFHKRRDRIFPPSEGQLRMAVMKKFGFTGILWDQLVSFKTTSSGTRNRT
jgi:radical SAM superfamily enzyme YgiQ (UPF0313 family)